MHVLRVVSAVCLLLSTSACLGEASGDANGVWQPPEIIGVMPRSGPQTGGTRVTLSGANFQPGARVFFGKAEGLDTQVSSKALLSVTTPESVLTGDVEVRVMNADGQSNAVMGTFHFDATGPKALVEALTVNPAVRRDSTGEAQISSTVGVEVEVTGITAGMGAGRGVRVQVGYSTAPVELSQLLRVNWVDANYFADGDGSNPGDLARDRFEGKVSLPGANGAEVKEYALLARVSIDDGASWTLTDRDGSANGTTVDQLPRVVVARPTIDFCKLGGEIVEAPPDVSLRLGMNGPVITAQAGKNGVTSNPGPGMGVSGQLGYGPVGSDPASAGWTWTPAAYSQDTGGGANDEYRVALPNPGVGTFAFAFRFNVEGGPYVYCDADGSEGGGYSSDQAGRVTVTPPNVDSCKLVPPATHLAQPNTASALLGARVFALAVTDGAGRGANVTGEVGYGPVGSQPGAGWTWVSANYASDQDENRADEYRGRVPPLAAGQYDVAYRFRYTGRPDVYCDLDGSGNGYSPAQAFKLTVAAATLQSCKVASVSTTSVASGGRLSVFGRVRVPGVSDATGPGVGIRGQVGVGAAGSNASAGGWAWKDAIFFGDVAGTGEDELRGDIQPSFTGARALSFRFSINNGETWTYCDLNGNDVGGYEVAQQPALTVTNHADLDFCGTQAPATVSSRIAPLTGRVTEAGLTDVAGEPAGMLAEIGYGPASEDPGVSQNWRWRAAEYSAQSGASDDYRATLGDATPSGTWAYAFRFARSLAAPYCYGDLDGHSATNGFTANLGQAVLP